MLNAIGLWTLTKREIQRTIRIINQAIWPPVVSTLLYFFIFGLSLGSRLRQIEGVSYLQFLVPGLIAMNVIEASYGETSASLFQGRFTNSIQELLVAPLSYLEMVLGFIAGSVLRALLIGNLIMGVGWIVTGSHPGNWLLYLVLMAGMAVVFSAIGLVLGLFAETFDQLAIPTTFVITPLVYFGGVFTSIHLLPERFQAIARANPLFYLIDAFRSSMTGHSEAGLPTDLAVLGTLMVGSIWLAVGLFRRGYKLRT